MRVQEVHQGGKWDREHVWGGDANDAAGLEMVWGGEGEVVTVRGSEGGKD